jgi:hypothetical protein
MKRETGMKARRRVYQKPRVEQVELLSEEVLQLGGCKHFTQVDSESLGNTAACHTPAACLDFGS